MFRNTSFLIAGLVGAALLATAALAEEEELYDDKYDGIDVDEILANERLRKQYFSCFLGNKPCLTDDANFFKEKFPDAMVTKCRKCTEKQKEMFEKVVNYFTTKEPDNWNLILKTVIERVQNKEKQRR